MEGLPRDIRHYLARRFLVLGSLRNLLCVSKSWYLMFKFYIKIQTVPFGGSYTPLSCVICNSVPVSKDPQGWANQGWAYEIHSTKAKLPKRSLEHLVPKKGAVECEQGHRFLCHAKDGVSGCQCKKCGAQLSKKIKL